MDGIGQTERCPFRLYLSLVGSGVHVAVFVERVCLAVIQRQCVDGEWVACGSNNLISIRANLLDL